MFRINDSFNRFKGIVNSSASEGQHSLLDNTLNPDLCGDHLTLIAVESIDIGAGIVPGGV
jgi:hypothetical protein